MLIYMPRLKKTTGISSIIISLFRKLYLLMKFFGLTKSYDLVEAEKEDMISIYKFRFHIYCEVDKLLEQSLYPEGQESDRFDNGSRHFYIRDRDKIVAYLRLIPACNFVLPTEREFGLDLSYIDRSKLFEISRFMVDPGYRGKYLSIDMYRGILLFAKNYEVAYYLSCVEDWFLSSFQSIFGKLNVIGDPKFCFNAWNHAFLLDVVNILNKVKLKRNIAYRYFNKYIYGF